MGAFSPASSLGGRCCTNQRGSPIESLALALTAGPIMVRVVYVRLAESVSQRSTLFEVRKMELASSLGYCVGAGTSFVSGMINESGGRLACLGLLDLHWALRWQRPGSCWVIF